MSGPEFSDLKPVNSRGYFDPFTQIAYSPGGLNEGTIFPVVPQTGERSLDCFREGETLILYLEVAFPPLQVAVQPDPPITTYISALRIKPHWLRSAGEFRTVGVATASGNLMGIMGGVQPTTPPAAAPVQVDSQIFGGWSVRDMPFDPATQGAAVNLAPPPAGGLGLGNRRVWFPTPKRLDTVPAALGSSPLNISVGMTSDSIFLDEVFYCPLPNPSKAPWNAAPWNTVTGGQLTAYKRAWVFHFPVLGRCLGFSFESVLANLVTDVPEPYPVDGSQPVPPNEVYCLVKAGYRSGVTHGVLQERAG